MSARTRELFALVPAAVLLAAGFAAIFLSREDLVSGLGGRNEISDVSITYGGIFLGLCVAAHIVIRITLPHADPYLFPLVALLACFGLVEIYRIDDTLARQQAQWFVIGLGAFAATIVALRDYRKLERYRYTIAARRHRAAAAAAAVRAGQRRLPRRSGIGSISIPARRVDEDRDRHLPRRAICATRAR